MSKLSEYSKFDHLVDLSDDDEGEVVDVPRVDASKQQQQRQQQQQYASGVNRNNATNNNNNNNKGKTPTTTTITQSTRCNANPQPSNNAASALARGVTIAAESSSSLERSEATKRFVFCYQGRLIYEFEQSLTELILYIPVPPTIVSAKQIACQIMPRHLQVGLSRGTGGESRTSSSINNTPATLLSRSTIPWFLDEPTGGIVDVSESTWCLSKSTPLSPRPSTMSAHNNVDVSSTPPAEARAPTTTTSALKTITTTPTPTSAATMVIEIYLHKAAKGLVWDCALAGPHSPHLNAWHIQEVQKELMLERWQEEHAGMDFRDAQFNGSNIPDPRTFMGGISY